MSSAGEGAGAVAVASTSTGFGVRGARFAAFGFGAGLLHSHGTDPQNMQASTVFFAIQDTGQKVG
jgi:hypothetical protein